MCTRVLPSAVRFTDYHSHTAPVSTTEAVWLFSFAHYADWARALWHEMVADLPKCCLKSRAAPERKSYDVRMPTRCPSSTTGKQPTLLLCIMSRASSVGVDDDTV